MSWRLRTDVDLNTGETFKAFTYVDEDGDALILVPEGPALELVRELMKTYPDAIQAIASDLKEEIEAIPAQTPAPAQGGYQSLYEEEEDEPPPQVPQAPMVKGRIRRPEGSDVEDTPLRIPGEQQTVTLQSLAPRGEREVPQG